MYTKWKTLYDSEMWMKWIKRESGAEHSGDYEDIFSVGDNGHGWGRYQDDTRYGLPALLSFCVQNSPNLFGSFAPYVKMSASQLTNNRDLIALWLNLCAAYGEEFAILQDKYNYAKYYAPTKKAVLSDLGIDLDKRSMSLKGSIFSFAIRSGPGECITKKLSKSTGIMAGCSNSMSDEQILRKAYSFYGTSDAGRWPEQLQDALAFLKTEPILTERPVFNAAFSLAKTAAICADAKKTKSYGDSHSEIPCADGLISCDRMLARSDWDANNQLGLGMPDQQSGGYTVLTMEEYYNSTGLFDKILNPESLQAGDRVLMKEVGTDRPTANWHAFQIAAFRSISDIDKYDLGSQERIQAGGYFKNVPLDEWGNKDFYAAWRLKADDGIQNGGGSNVGTKVSNCSISENGSVNGTPGDSTGREYYLRDWYQHNPQWKAILRPKRADVAASIAKDAKAAASNDHIGYGQYGNSVDSGRGGMWAHCVTSNYDPAQITVNCNADCSSSTAAIVKCAGYKLNIPSLKNVSSDMCTSDEIDTLSETGEFEVLRDSKYLTSGDYLKSGDIEVATGHTNIIYQGAADSEPEPVPTPTVDWEGTGTATANVDSLNVRSEPNGKIIDTLGIGNRVEVDGQTNGEWTHVGINANGSYLVGWIYSEYLTMDTKSKDEPTYPVGTCSEDGTIVYTDSDFTHPMRSLDKGNLVDVMEKETHTVFKVRIGDAIGYVRDNIK